MLSTVFVGRKIDSTGKNVLYVKGLTDSGDFDSDIDRDGLAHDGDLGSDLLLYLQANSPHLRPRFEIDLDLYIGPSILFQGYFDGTGNLKQTRFSFRKASAIYTGGGFGGDGRQNGPRDPHGAQTGIIVDGDVIFHDFIVC